MDIKLFFKRKEYRREVIHCFLAEHFWKEPRYKYHWNKVRKKLMEQGEI